MRKRLLLGLITMLSAIAVQEGFFGTMPEISIDSETQLGQSVKFNSIDANKTSAPLVTRVVDGDTIIVQIDGASEKVRLIGVDTPETVDPRKPVQCFGKEASNFTKTLLLNKQIVLETDPSQGDRDKYGRLLRYVFLNDGTLVNQKIITDGYGHEYTYRIPYKYQTEFKNAERSARESQKGLWGQGVCGA